MARNSQLVAESRDYRVINTQQAKKIVTAWLKDCHLISGIELGLPEIDDRYDYWRVSLCTQGNVKIGEVVIDAYSTAILVSKTTKPELLKARLLKQDKQKVVTCKKQKKDYKLSNLRNTIGLGDAENLIQEMPAESVDLIFTSPPYFNARPEYSEYAEYDEYLLKMRQIIRQCHRVLVEGRFFVINISPVLLRRASRNQSSQRIAVPFDFHRLFIEEGYDFIDDIIWVKPEGAGWATGRGRRFAADRNPLQYKAVPVTEYVLVYRKKSDVLIDWFIRNHPDRQIIEDSKIGDDYERTNIWRINPATNSKHPAAFPKELAEKVIRYYSFKGDVVLDPFAGSGTVGEVAAALHRRFVLLEKNPQYLAMIQAKLQNWQNVCPQSILWLTAPSPNVSEI
ncbi:MAG: site-specific DNA-methyltransferase [Merismopediaceae bacterium]|nr:site-specific DNA-methyltransferase [Merismopediaceae bacterium]